MRTIILILALLIAGCCKVEAQSKASKWEKCGWSYYGDTTEYTYSLKGKDSIIYKIETDICNCDVYTDVGTHTAHSCKGLKRHYIMTNFYTWQKTVTMAHGKVISETKPKWVTNNGIFSTVDGSFEINGKFVQPAKLYYKDRILTISEY